MKLRDYLVILLIAILDQFTKWAAVHYLTYQTPVKIIDGFFYLTYAKNTGAAWSILEGQGWLFIVFAIVAVAYIIYYLNTSKNTSKLMKIALLFIAGGAIGNVIDRIHLKYVIDFLDFYIFGYDFPIFNVADSFITVGMFILVAAILLEKE